MTDRKFSVALPWGMVSLVRISVSRLVLTFEIFDLPIALLAKQNHANNITSIL